MIARHPPAKLFAALLALIALAGMFALSTWHVAQAHDADPIHMVAMSHAHPDDQGDDPDAIVHLAAHAAGQAVAFPVQAAMTLTAPASRQVWTTVNGALRPGREPASLLRPPRD